MPSRTPTEPRAVPHKGDWLARIPASMVHRFVAYDRSDPKANLVIPFPSSFPTHKETSQAGGSPTSRKPDFPIPRPTRISEYQRDLHWNFEGFRPQFTGQCCLHQVLHQVLHQSRRPHIHLQRILLNLQVSTRLWDPPLTYWPTPHLMQHLQILLQHHQQLHLRKVN